MKKKAAFPTSGIAGLIAIAYSYIRFSSPEQMKGDSLRRQSEAAAAWCERNGARLDTSTTLHDLGKSAFTGAHRSNPDRHALAAFLKLVEQGRVPRGSYLVIENLDRLSREHIQPALLLALSLLQAGVRIVQLKPVEMVFDDKSDTLPVMMMMMELSRGHSESAMKSERNGAAWQAKLARAREKGEVLTGPLPAWVQKRDGKLYLITERAAVVKRIFSMAANGYGMISIVRRLTDEGVPAWGHGKRKSGKVWIRAYVAKILKDRRALGEYQPRGKGRRPEGEPIRNYFPAVVTEEEWAAARAGAAQRRNKRGRLGKYLNLFAGMLRHARDGDTYFMTEHTHGKSPRVLVNTAGAEGRADYVSFSADTFEQAVLSQLREIDPHDILNGDSGPDESLVLSGKLTQVEAKIAELEAELLQGDVAALARVLRQLEAQKRDLASRLAEARRKAAHPLSEAWGETQSLAEALDAHPDPTDARLRLRSALRRIIDAIWILVVPRGKVRLCVCQVWFADGKRHRDYLILHRPPYGNKSVRLPGAWKALGLAEVVKHGDIDLRKREHARRTEKYLAGIDLEVLEEMM